VRPLVYAIDRYEALAERFCALPLFERGHLERRDFPDGERYLRILDDLRGRDAVVIGGTIDDRATLELFDIASGLVGLGVNTLSLVVPYFGYSTQERAVWPGEVVTAKARAVLLSAVPRARVTNEIVLLDLHTPGISHYFEGYLHSVHLSGEPLALSIVEGIAAKTPTVVACTDAGRAKWVQSLANRAGLIAAFVYKSRSKSGQVSVTGVNADVNGKHVVIYDDMVRTGSSLLQAAEAYRDAGAAAITAITTHAPLPGDSLTKIKDSGLLTALHCTDSHPHVLELAPRSGGFLKVQSVTDLYADLFRGRSS
jgi:ribose-phosphate pyrophosphokinase